MHQSLKVGPFLKINQGFRQFRQCPPMAFLQIHRDIRQFCQRGGRGDVLCNEGLEEIEGDRIRTHRPPLDLRRWKQGDQPKVLRCPMLNGIYLSSFEVRWSLFQLLSSFIVRIWNKGNNKPRKEIFVRIHVREMRLDIVNED